MEIKRTLLPGQAGTRELLRRYGDQLVCVRYRYDKARQQLTEETHRPLLQGLGEQGVVRNNFV